MPQDKIEVYIKNTGTSTEVPGGCTLAEIAATLQAELGFEPICAKVNNKTENLGYAIYQPKLIEYAGVESPGGQRAYTRSLCMLLYAALCKVSPGASLAVEHSVSNGYYCQIGNSPTPLAGLLPRLRCEMSRMVAAALPFVREQLPTEQAIAHFTRQGLASKVELLGGLHSLFTTCYSLDGIYDSYYGVLAPNTSLLTTWDLQMYKDGLLLLGPDSANPAAVPPVIAQEKMYQAYADSLAFNHIVGVSNVGQLNTAIASRKSADVVNVSEALHDKSLARISDEITRRYNAGGARIVLIAGPSSSGKTTSTKRLAIQLTTNLLKPQLISLDNYFVDRAHTPLDADGEYDYESIYALDLEQFNADLTDILAGKEVALPTYNFETGSRQYRGNTIKLQKRSILLIEGIHGLNPLLTSHIPEDQKFRLYVSALTTISLDSHNRIPSTDNRLLRRIIRDHKYRGTSALDTIKRWPSVRRGEEKWIFPYQENADATFNSALLYELAVMKDIAEPILKKVPHDAPEYSESYRLLKFLGYFDAIDLRLVPSTSLLREFLGGSSFKY